MVSVADCGKRCQRCGPSKQRVVLSTILTSMSACMRNSRNIKPIIQRVLVYVVETIHVIDFRIFLLICM